MTVLRPTLPLLCLLLGCADVTQPAAATDPADALSWSAERGPVRLDVQLAPKQPRLSDEPTLTLTITADPDVDVAPPPFGDSLGGFLVRDFHQPLPRQEDGRQVLQQVYTLEPLAVGKQTILPIPVAFVDRRAGADQEATHQVVTDPQTVEVISLLAEDVPRLADLQPAAEPLLPPTPPLSRWWIGGPLLAVAALVALLWFLRSRAARTPPPQLTPTQHAERELQQLLRADPLGQGDVKTYYVELTAIVRRYLERTTGIRAPEQTTAEFLQATRQDATIPAELRQRLAAFLESADLVKFAAFEPGREEVDASLHRAREFVGLASRPAPATHEVAS